MRWEAMMAKLRGHTIQQWFADFTDALHECRLDREELVPVVTEPALWPVRSATNGGARYH
jgi:trehalose 6-phosphate synthase